VYCPLFSAFGPEPVRSRLQLGSVRVLVTTDLLYRRKVAVIRNELPGLKHVLVLRTPGAGDLAGRYTGLRRSDARCIAGFQRRAHFAGGLRAAAFHERHDGNAKGVLHAHAAVTAHVATARWVLDLQRDDVYWCTADPGWVTGISYGSSHRWRAAPP